MTLKAGLAPAHGIKTENLKRGSPTDFKLDEDTIEFSFSSEYAVERKNWGYTEVLSHDPGCCDLSRVEMGAAPLLWNHDQDSVIGRIEKAWIDPISKRGRCKARWGSSDLAEQIRRDVRNGIIQSASCFYSIRNFKEDGSIIRAIDWEIMEISIVAIPADPNVGIGRSDSTKGINIMPSIANQERERVLGIESLRDNYSHRDPEINEILDNCLEEGTGIDASRAKIADLLLGGDERPPVTGMPRGNASRSYGGGVVLKDSEAAQFSFRDVILNQIDPTSGGSLALELHQDLSRRGYRAQNGGIMVPTGILAAKRAAPYLTSSATTSAIVPDSYMPGLFIDALREQSMTGRLGIRFEGMPPGTVTIPRQSGISKAEFVAENADLPDVSPEFSTINLAPKQLGCWTSFSRQMLTQSVPGFDSLLASDFGLALSEGIDDAVINSNGVDPNPRGLLNTAGVNTIAIGPNGGPIDYSTLVSMETPLNRLNVPRNGRGFLLPTDLETVLKTSTKFGSGTESTIWENDAQNEGMGRICGYRAVSSNYLPTNLTKGTGTNLTAAIFGHWADVWVGTWDAIEILANPFGSGFRRGEIEMRAFWTVDLCVRRPESFTVITDIETA